MSFQPIAIEIPERKPATHGEIAALEFAPAKELRRLSKTARLTKSHEMVDRVRPMLVLAAEIVAMKKEKLIALVDEDHKTFGPFLMDLAHAGKDAEALAGIIRTAEIRLAVALANVEPDEDGTSPPKKPQRSARSVGGSVT